MAASAVSSSLLSNKSCPRIAAGERFLNFVNETGSPYHSVLACKRLLLNNGFIHLNEKNKWLLNKGGKYFITRNDSEILSFIIGNNYNINNSGLLIIGAHTDSPCLRLRPKSPLNNGKEGMIQLGVSTYGGGLWHTWFDRPLGLAGKIEIKNNNNSISEKLIRINKPIAIIPNLAIHLQNNDERSSFKINTEEHLMPIFCSTKYYNNNHKDDNENDDGSSSMINGNNRALMELLANEAGCNINDIIDFDICMMDATPSCLIGKYNEFINSPRIDNLLSTWACINSICDISNDLSNNGNDIYIAAAFDHEECGSTSYTGANSMTLQTWIKRILLSININTEGEDIINNIDKYYPEIIAKSMLISADGAHAIHPNYSNKHQNEHKVYLHNGIVFKYNSNQRYATNTLTASMIKQLCINNNIPIQDFVVRNDSPCGSTIGPMMSSNIGIRTIDIGASQWAMHSCRETCSIDDANTLYNFCKIFYKYWKDIDNNLVEVSD